MKEHNLAFEIAMERVDAALADYRQAVEAANEWWAQYKARREAERKASDHAVPVRTEARVDG